MSESTGGADFDETTIRGRRAPGIAVIDSTVELRTGGLHVRTYRAGEGKDLPLVLFFPDVASGKKTGEWISSWLASAIAGVVLEVRPKAAIASNLILDWASVYAPTIGASVDRIAVLGSGAGADSALESFDPLSPGLASGIAPAVSPVRLVMISPSSAAGANGVPRGLPTVLLQVTRPKTGRHPAVALLEELKDAGSPGRIIEYLGKDRDWVASPRSVRTAHERLMDTITFLRRGLVDDSYAIVPNWNMH
jgi:hypothetical protein